MSGGNTRGESLKDLPPFALDFGCISDLNAGKKESPAGLRLEDHQSVEISAVKT